MRNQIILYLNGQRVVVDQRDSLLSLSDFLRLRRNLTGTKVVCSEGDCGACSVLIGRPDSESLKYKSADSCILFMFQLDGAHVVTVEGLGSLPELTPVQQAMVDCHGSQCGFCTPGFVTAMTGILEDNSCLGESEMRAGLTGNLCRCTGYTSIFEAGEAVSLEKHQRLEQLYPASEILPELENQRCDSLELSVNTQSSTTKLFLPSTLAEALRLLEQHPGATIVSGATDLGVRINKTRTLPETVVDINRLHELEQVEVFPDRLEIGARVTWTALEAVCASSLPQFGDIVSVFGSPQIRNLGTIGGNIINASPIADSLPLLHVMNAELELTSSAGARSLDINQFYRGYKQFDLQPGELLTRIALPLPADDELLKLYKVSRRRDLDISSFTAAIRMRLDGDTIGSATIAYGAVGPTVLRLAQTEAFLLGAPWSEATMLQAGEIAVSEITPISDVRGSADYRRQLARNVLLKFFHEQQPAALVA